MTVDRKFKRARGGNVRDCPQNGLQSDSRRETELVTQDIALVVTPTDGHGASPVS
jgi:hypothetical protein